MWVGGFRGGFVGRCWGWFVSRFRFMISGFGFMISRFGFMVSGSGMRVSFGFVFWVDGFSFVFDISDVSVFISMIGDNLDTAVG